MTPFQNIYYERKVATAKPCYICRRETTTVLSTLKTEDFLYTCEGHLSDPATLIPPSNPGPSAEDIKKVIADYHVREARKAEASKDKDKDKGKDDVADKDKGVEKDKEKNQIPTPPPSIPSANTSAHRKFALHRQIFEMRQNEIKKKEQGVKAREVGKGLPQVPRGMFWCVFTVVPDNHTVRLS